MPRRVPYIPPADSRPSRGRSSGPSDKRQARPAKKHRSDPKVRARAEELADNGMPFQLAMAVALGRVSLNEALERLARQERVQKVIDEYDLSRALATQVVIGHASLDAVLARRRLKEHRAENRDRSCLDQAHDSGEPLGLALHGKERITGQIQAVDAYTVTVLESGATAPQEVHKLQLKYAWNPDDAKKLRRALRTDKALAADPKEPIPRPQDRYTCSDKRLFLYLDAEQPVLVTLLEGEQLRGTITWFSRYEFGLQLKDIQVVIFRHCLHDLADG